MPKMHQPGHEQILQETSGIGEQEREPKTVEAAARPERMLQEAEAAQPAPPSSRDVPRQPSTRQPHGAAFARMAYEQQQPKAAQTITPDETVTTIPMQQPELAASPPARREEIETEPIHENPLPAMDTEHTMPAAAVTMATVAYDDPAVSDTAPAVNASEWLEEPSEIALPAGETAAADISTESTDAIGMIAPADDMPVTEAALSYESTVTTSREDELDAEVLSQEPLKDYQVFTAALQTFADRSEEHPPAAAEDEPTHDVGDEVDNAADGRALKAPVLAAAVIERLHELRGEEKETAALTIGEIVETMLVLEALKTDEAEPEMIEAVQMKLEDSVVELVTQLGLKFEPEVIEKFVAALHRSIDQPSKTQAAETITADLENEGTHEAKRHFPQLPKGLTDAEDKILHLLGKIILLYFDRASPLPSSN